jgi:hypothetical protein
MAITIALLAAAILVIAAVSMGVLAVLAIGIHGDHQSGRLSNTPRTYAESITRKVLGVTVRTSNPDHGTPEEG